MWLRVERPCRVRRQPDGGWGWQCTLCPAPLRELVTTADSWRAAFDDAVEHVRFDHARTRRPDDAGPAVPAPGGCGRCGGAGWVWLRAVDGAGVVRVVEASCPVCCGPGPAVVEAWREAHRWCPTALPCRRCGGPTHLRDGDGAPLHRLCGDGADLFGEDAPSSPGSVKPALPSSGDRVNGRLGWSR